MEIANTRIRYGVNRIHVLLRREGWQDNKKACTDRVYKEEGLNLRSKRPRRSKVAALRMERPKKVNLHQCWFMDFVADQLFNGSFRDECLNVNWFMSMDDEEEKNEEWRHEYNHNPPHSSLNNLTPMD